MSRRRDGDVFDAVGQQTALFVVLILAVGLAVAVWVVYQSGKVITEAAGHEPRNRFLLGSGGATVGFLLLSVQSWSFLIPAALSLAVLVTASRVIQLHHARLLERTWGKGIFLHDILRERW